VLWLDTAAEAATITIPFLPMISQSYYRPQGNYAAVSGILSRQYFTLLYVPYVTTIDRIGIRTSSSYSGTGISRLGIYADSQGVPGLLISDFGTLATDASSTNYEISVLQTLNAGFYWLSFAQQTSPTTISYQGISSVAASQNYHGLPVTLSATGGSNTGYQQDNITGSFVNITSTLTQSTTSLTPYVRAK
jgi:hypothetical protein